MRGMVVDLLFVCVKQLQTYKQKRRCQRLFCMPEVEIEPTTLTEIKCLSPDGTQLHRFQSLGAGFFENVW